jgi:hypothetical protein
MMGSKGKALVAIAGALVALLAACSDFSTNAEAINPSSGGGAGVPPKLNWTASTLPSDTPQAYYSVIYANGQFTAVGNGLVAVSTDGFNWTAQKYFTIADMWGSSSYGNGLFVLVDINNPKAAASKDGSTWTRSALPAVDPMVETGYGTGYNSVTYGNGRFVAIGGNTKAKTAAYSIDGITWTRSDLPSLQNWRSVTYGDGLFVAVSSNSDAAAYSSDGVTWTATTLPRNQSWFSVTYGNGIFVAVAISGDAVAISTDGKAWTASTLPSVQDWRTVTYGDGLFVAIGSITSYTDGTDVAAISADGKTWTSSTLPVSDRSWRSVTYGNGTFVAVDVNGSAVTSSK